MLLYRQLQEGLRGEVLKSSAVAGAVLDTKLFEAAKSEEQCQAEWKRRQQYRRVEQVEQAKQDARPPPSSSSSSTQANKETSSQIW